MCGSEKDCDEFHEKVDDFLLDLAQQVKQTDPICVGEEKRKQEVIEVRDRPTQSDDKEGCYDYRYRRILGFLQSGEVIPAPEKKRTKQSPWALRRWQRTRPPQALIHQRNPLPCSGSPARETSGACQ